MKDGELVHGLNIRQIYVAIIDMNKILWLPLKNKKEPMTNTTTLKEAIFNKYAENIELFHKNLGIQPEIDGKICNEKFYICPICNRGYFKESLETKIDNHLTLEHVPPEKLRGKTKLLTCKECNNISGEKLDAQLIWYVSQLNNGIDERAKVNINNQYQTSGAIKQNKKEKPQIKIDLYHNSPLHKNFDDIKNNWKQSVTNIKFQLPNPNTIQLSLLRITFLMMYEKFGMGYLYTKSGQNIREIIHKNDVNRIKPFVWKPNIENNILKPGIYFMDTLGKRNG